MELEIKDMSTDAIIQKDIISNAVTNDEYLKLFATIPHWKGLIPVEWADTVLSACVAFYKKYKAAPKKQYILDYLNQNQKEFRFSDSALPAMLEFIEGIEEKAINPAFEIDNTLLYLKRKALTKTKDRIEAALDADNVQLAEDALKDGKPSKQDEVEELDVLNMDDALQEATSINEEPLISMGGAFGELVCPHIKTGKFVFFVATAKAGKTWCLYTLASMAYNSGRNVLIFSSGDMDKSDNSIRIGHIMSRNDTASDPTHTGIYAYPVLDCMLNQDQSCQISTNKVALADYIEKETQKYDTPEKLLATMPPNYAPCANCKTCDKCVPTWCYEPHDVQYKGWQGLNTHKDISKRRNGKVKFRIKIYPNNTLTTTEIEKQIANCAEIEKWVPDLVIIDYADIMAWEVGDTERDNRHKENTRWKNLRKLSQSKYRPCILTVTQSNRAGYNMSSLDATNVNEDRRKLDHATAVFSLNQTPLEKEYRIARTACLMARGKSASSYREIILLQAYESGRFVRDSFWRRKKKENV